jgi:hypothetical protein
MTRERKKDQDSLLLPVTELRLLAIVADLGREMMAQADEEDPDTDPLEYYGEWFMENMSEAGYSEARPWNRRSARAFVNLLRLHGEDAKGLKGLLGYDRTDYRQFAFAQTVLDVLSRTTELAPALKLLAVDREEKDGPFYPNLTEFDSAAGLRAAAVQAVGEGDNLLKRYAANLTERHAASADADSAVLALAGLFRVSPDGLRELASHLPGDRKQTLLAYAVLEALRATPRLTTGLNWAQPSEKSES